MSNLAIIMNLLVVWMFVSIILALLWFIYTQHENMFYEREANKEEREKLMQERERLLELASTERKDLYDRLQAGTLSQYKEHQGDPDNQLDEDAEETVVDLESAKEELMQENG